MDSLRVSFIDKTGMAKVVSGLEIRCSISIEDGTSQGKAEVEALNLGDDEARLAINSFRVLIEYTDERNPMWNRMFLGDVCGYRDSQQGVDRVTSLSLKEGWFNRTLRVKSKRFSAGTSRRDFIEYIKSVCDFNVYYDDDAFHFLGTDISQSSFTVSGDLTKALENILYSADMTFQWDGPTLTIKRNSHFVPYSAMLLSNNTTLLERPMFSSTQSANGQKKLISVKCLPIPLIRPQATVRITYSSSGTGSPSVDGFFKVRKISHQLTSNRGSSTELEVYESKPTKPPK